MLPPTGAVDDAASVIDVGGAPATSNAVAMVVGIFEGAVVEAARVVVDVAGVELGTVEDGVVVVVAVVALSASRSAAVVVVALALAPSSQ